MSCDASVSVDGFDSDGRISFTVDTNACTNSRGRFNYDCRIRDKYGNITTHVRASGWPRTIGSSTVRVDEDLRLVDRELLSVDVVNSSIDCTCDSDYQPQSFGEPVEGGLPRLLTASVMTSAIDPDTYQQVSQFYTDHHPLGKLLRLRRILDVRVLWGQLSLDLDHAKEQPNKVDQFERNIKNCAQEVHKFSLPKTTIKTKNTLTVEVTQTVQTSTETKLGFTFDLSKAAKLNASLVAKNSLNVCEKKIHGFEEDFTVEFAEKEFEAKPRMMYTERKLITKGMLLVPVTGQLVIDALVEAQGFGAPLLWMSVNMPDPNTRLLEFKGMMLSELKFEREDYSFFAKSLPANDPRCRDNAVLETNDDISVWHSSYIELPPSPSAKA